MKPFNWLPSTYLRKKRIAPDCTEALWGALGQPGVPSRRVHPARTGAQERFSFPASEGAVQSTRCRSSN